MGDGTMRFARAWLANFARRSYDLLGPKGSGQVKPTICIDPGHGGENLGVHVDGFKEEEWTLTQSLWLRRALMGTGWCKVVMTREDDSSVSFYRRNQIANETHSAIVISVHVDSGGPASSGLHTLYWPGNVRTQQVGDIITRSAPEPIWRTKSKSYAATREAWPRAHGLIAQYRAPVILVECGFATSEKDRRFISTDAGHWGVTAAILTGVAHFLGVHHSAIGP